MGLVLVLASCVVACAKPAQPEFQVVSVQILPLTATSKERANVYAEVKNSGSTEGAHTLTLTIDGVKAQTKVVKVAPGETEIVTFTIVEDEAGTYNVEVNGLSGTFQVIKAAEFTASNLVISPPIVEVGQMATVTADVTNAGEVEGSYSVALMINGNKVETKELTVAPGATLPASFSFTEDATGSHSIEVAGLAGFLIVTVPGGVLALEALNAAYPELCQELLQLPDLEEIDERDNEAIEDIVSLALNPQYRPAFESMLDEGVKGKRKYCAPLETLLWIAYDRELRAYHQLNNYSVAQLIKDAWENTTTSKSYASERWQDFDEVINRLNSPDLVSIYMKNNIKYRTDMSLYGKEEYLAPPLETFNNKAGDCEDHARFALYCLLKNGYHYNQFEVHATNAVCGLHVMRYPRKQGEPFEGHDVCLYKVDGLIYCLDNTGWISKGPFSSVEHVADRMYSDWDKYVIYGNPGSVRKISENKVDESY